MSHSKFLYAFVGLLAGCLIGFFAANTVNRHELETTRGELASLRESAGQRAPGGGGDAAGNAALKLTDSEVRNVLAKADASPRDTAMQRKVGQGLYLYAARMNRPELLPDAVRLLKRAWQSEPKDYDTIVLVGNALFDLGQADDLTRLVEARSFYEKALAVKPGDVNVRTDLGLTYYFAKPSDPQRAISEYRKSLALDARHEMTLQNLSAALITTGAFAEARQRIEELQGVDAANPALPNLRAQLVQAENAAKEQP